MFWFQSGVSIDIMFFFCTKGRARAGGPTSGKRHWNRAKLLRRRWESRVPPDFATFPPFQVQFSYLFLFQSLSYSTNWKTLEFTTLLCLKLVEICLKKSTLKDNLDVICQAIKLLFTSICRQRGEVNESVDQDKRQDSEENSISQLLTSLRTRIVSDLFPTMSSYDGSESLRRELLVCKRGGNVVLD